MVFCFQILTWVVSCFLSNDQTTIGSFGSLLVHFSIKSSWKIIDNNDRYKFTLFALICNDLNVLRYAIEMHLKSQQGLLYI